MIGIVIPSHNDRNFLEPLFESLYSCPPGHPFWPLVVDDMSNDGTEDWLRGLGSYASVIRAEQKLYFTRAVNVGLRWLNQRLPKPPEYYLLLNSDIIVTPNWAGSLIATSISLDAGIVGATLLNPDGTVQHAGGWGVGYHYGINQPRFTRYEDRRVPWVTGASMLIRNDVIATCGELTAKAHKQYDESDRDYCVNARLNGFEIACSAGAVMYHFTLASMHQRGDDRPSAEPYYKRGQA